MSNQRPSFAKRDREMKLKDKARAKAERRAARRAEAKARASGPIAGDEALATTPADGATDTSAQPAQPASPVLATTNR